MKRLWHLVLWLLGGATGVVCAVAVYLVCAFFWPSLLVNSASLRLVAAAAALKGVYIQWDTATVHATSESTWQKSIAIDISKICVQMPTLNLSTCMPQLQLALSADVEPKHLRLISIGPVNVVGRHFSMGPFPETTEPASPPIDWAHLQRPPWLQGTVLHEIHLAVQQVQVQDPGWRIEGGVDLTVAAPAPDPQAVGSSSSLLSLQLSSFCLREGPVAVDGCVGSGLAQVRIALVDELYTLTQIGPLQLKADKLGLRLPAAAAESSAAAKPQPTAAASWPLPEVLRQARWMPMQVDVGAWEVKRGTLTASGKLAVNVTQKAGRMLFAADLGRFCADDSGEGLHLCFSALDAQATMQLNQDRLALSEVGPVHALGGALRLRSPEPEPGAEVEAPTAHKVPTLALDPTKNLVPEWLKRATLAPVQVNLDQIDVQRGDFALRGGLTVDGHGIGRGALWDIRASATSGKTFKRAKTHLQLASGRGHFVGPWRLDADGRTDLSETSFVELKARTRDLGHETLGFHLQVDAEREQKQASGKIDGTLDPFGLAAELTGSMQGLVPSLKQVALHNCRLHLQWRHAWPDQGDLGLGCQVTVEPELLPHQEEIPLDWPNAVTLELAASAQSPLPPGGDGAVTGNLTMRVKPVATKELAASSETALAISGDLAHLPSSLHVLTTSTTRVEIADFAAVVRSLGASPYAIPAPLNVLKGKIIAQIQASGDLTNGGVEVPLSFTSRLQSGEPSRADRQSLNTDMQGSWHLDPFGPQTTSLLAVKAELTDVQLALPRIALNDKAPQILPDKRMRDPKKHGKIASSEGVGGLEAAPFVGPPAPPPKSAFAYSVEIATPASNPLHLLSNLAKEPVPIQVAVQSSSDAPTSGHISVREFPLNLFRRQAYVDKFDIALASPEASPTIDGKLRVEYPDYTITILLLGTLKSPEIKLTSEPIRPENQLIAVLLFGKEMSDLDDDQLKSVDNFGGAAADSALSLASMYLLASTPVQSVGYNPQTEAFTAKINVGKGTSVNIGSDLADYQKLGVQKRLARGWAIETYIERNADTDTDAVTALLEWSRRF